MSEVIEAAKRIQEARERFDEAADNRAAAFAATSYANVAGSRKDYENALSFYVQRCCEYFAAQLELAKVTNEALSTWESVNG